MRIVELRYRIHRTSFLGGGQWYFGQNLGHPEHGLLYETREDAQHDADIINGMVPRIGLADVEEYEIQPVNQENSQ